MATPHLNREALRALAVAAGKPTPLSPQHNTHLELCPVCRGRLRALLLTEQPNVQALIGVDFGDLFATCLLDDEALRLVRNQLDALEAETIAFHLEECVACRTLIADLTAFADSMKTLPAPGMPTVVPEPITTAPQQTLRERASSWFIRLGMQAASTRERLQPAAHAYGFATASTEVNRQPLAFDSPAFTGSYRAEKGRLLLHLEHASCPPGTLVLLEAMSPSEQVAWYCLAVFRKGMRRSILDVETTGSAEPCTLRVGLLKPGAISPICTELPVAYTAQVRADAAARSGWEIWARNILSELSEPDCRAIAQAILTDTPSE